MLAFTVTAKKASSIDEKIAKNAVKLEDLAKAKEVEIGGRRFWTAETPLKEATGGLIRVVYATQVDGYLLEFKIAALSMDTTAELEKDIAQITFFNPSISRQAAGDDSKPYIPGASPFPASTIGKLSAGTILRNSYANKDLGFRYEFPQNWVLMSKSPGKEFVPDDSSDSCTRQLLFVRKYVENPDTGQFNPMIVLIAADRRCISAFGFPKSVEDHRAIQQIASDTMMYFKNAGETPASPAKIRAFNSPNGVMIDISQNFNLSIPGRTAPMAVFSSLLMMESQNCWIIWMFAAGDDKELEELRTTKIFPDDLAAPRQ